MAATHRPHTKIRGQRGLAAYIVELTATHKTGAGDTGDRSLSLSRVVKYTLLLFTVYASGLRSPESGLSRVSLSLAPYVYAPPINSPPSQPICGHFITPHASGGQSSCDGDGVGGASAACSGACLGVSAKALCAFWFAVTVRSHLTELVDGISLIVFQSCGT